MRQTPDGGISSAVVARGTGTHCSCRTSMSGSTDVDAQSIKTQGAIFTKKKYYDLWTIWPWECLCHFWGLLDEHNMHCCIVRWQLQAERSELPIDRAACAYDEVIHTRLLLQLVGELLQVAAIKCKWVSLCAIIHVAQIISNVVMDRTSLYLVQGGGERIGGLEIWKKIQCRLLFWTN